MKNNARRTRVTVSADGRGLVSQAGAVLLLGDDPGHRPGRGPVRGLATVAGAAGGTRPGEDHRGPRYGARAGR